MEKHQEDHYVLFRGTEYLIALEALIEADPHAAIRSIQRVLERSIAYEAEVESAEDVIEKERYQDAEAMLDSLEERWGVGPATVRLRTRISRIITLAQLRE